VFVRIVVGRFAAVKIKFLRRIEREIFRGTDPEYILFVRMTKSKIF